MKKTGVYVFVITLILIGLGSLVWFLNRHVYVINPRYVIWSKDIKNSSLQINADRYEKMLRAMDDLSGFNKPYFHVVNLVEGNITASESGWFQAYNPLKPKQRAYVLACKAVQKKGLLFVPMVEIFVDMNNFNDYLPTHSNEISDSFIYCHLPMFFSGDFSQSDKNMSRYLRVTNLFKEMKNHLTIFDY